jgi:ribosome-associated protein
MSLDTTEALARSVADLALDRKALNVIVIDLRQRSSYADFLVIASGTSDRHVQAIAENVEVELGKRGMQALGSEGLREGQWALVDFGSVVLHVFHEYTRQVYDLEQIWSDAPRLRLAELAGATSRAHL